MRAVVIPRHGAPDVLEVQDAETPAVTDGHVLVRTEAMGLNFHDIIERRSGYPGNEPPVRAGLEGAGRIVAVPTSRPSESGLDIGQRVMWGAVPGSHADYVLVPMAQAIPIPDWLDGATAAAICSQGLTAHYLAYSLRPLGEGDTALVWAAAGGVGRYLTQMLAGSGVRVIAAVSSAEKTEVARQAGAIAACLNEGVDDQVRSATEGRGVDVVFDGVGAPTFDTSLSSLKPRGLFVSYGRAGGAIPPIAVERLSGAGSISLIRPRLVDFIATRDELLERASSVIAMLRRGRIAARIDATYSLDNVSDAHRFLESRKAIGKVLLTP